MVSHHLQPEAFSLCPIPGAPEPATPRESVSTETGDGRKAAGEPGALVVRGREDGRGDRPGDRIDDGDGTGEAEAASPVESVVGASRDSADEGLDFESVYRRYSPYVAKIGYRLLGRDSEVDDLVQDVFLAAHRGLHRIREHGAVKAWLITVTVRLARRRLRSRRLRGALHLDSSPDYSDIADPSVSPEQRALVVHVYRLLDRMPVNQRIAWSLRYIEGERLERVAELCECSLATAKRRIKAVQDRITAEVSRG